MSEIIGVFSGILAVYGLVFGVSAVAGLVLFVLRGIGLYEVAEKLGIKNAWLSFVPIVWIFSLGKISERYVKNDGSKSGKLGGWLLVLAILTYVFLTVFFVVTIIGIIVFARDAGVAVDAGSDFNPEMFMIFIPALISYIIAFVSSLAHQILYYIALWRYYSIMENCNATLYLVLSIIFSFLSPIFIFVLRNKQPKFTFEERMNINPTVNV